MAEPRSGSFRAASAERRSGSSVHAGDARWGIRVGGRMGGRRLLGFVSCRARPPSGGFGCALSGVGARRRPGVGRAYDGHPLRFISPTLAPLALGLGCAHRRNLVVQFMPVETREHRREAWVRSVPKVSAAVGMSFMVVPRHWLLRDHTIP